MLALQPKNRPTAADALNHRFFKNFNIKSKVLDQETKDTRIGESLADRNLKIDRIMAPELDRFETDCLI